MLEDFLGTRTIIRRGQSAVFRQYAQAVIRAGVRSGLNAAEITAGLQRTVGTAYRRENLLADVRAHQYELDISNALKALGDDARITNDLTIAGNPRGGQPFEYRFKVTGTNRYTGAAIDTYISVADDRRLTKGAARDQLLGSLGQSDIGSDRIAVDSAELDAVIVEA